MCAFQGEVPLGRRHEDAQAMWIETGKGSQIPLLGTVWKKNRLAEARHLGLSA